MLDSTFAPQHVNGTEYNAETAQNWPEYVNQRDNQLADDHFVTRNGKTFAGTHIIIDLWGAERLDDLELMEATLRKAVEVCGATLLHIHLHHFTPNGGISGVAVLAESHISVHTWPERGFAAFDVFMCGGARPELSIDIFNEAFSPKQTLVNELLRGEVKDD
ncbi:MAG: adenosylmethionine decarboxylase [Gammaproteobacteria bacterium]|nr:MAG: adenosylmethionine decarboxylase [Gammaproteobacteria bacterium]